MNDYYKSNRAGKRGSFAAFLARHVFCRCYSLVNTCPAFISFSPPYPLLVLCGTCKSDVRTERLDSPTRWIFLPVRKGAVANSFFWPRYDTDVSITLLGRNSCLKSWWMPRAKRRRMVEGACKNYKNGENSSRIVLSDYSFIVILVIKKNV